MEIKEINDKLLTNKEKDQKKAIKSIGKSGFIVADGVILEYDPNTSQFEKVTDEERIFNIYLKSISKPTNVIDKFRAVQMLKSELPNFTTKEVRDFKTYIQWIDVPIDSALIKELMDKAIAENETFKTDQELKGKYNLLSQMLILRNNDIFTNGNFLLKLEDGKFKVVDSKYIRELLNDIIANPGDNIPLQLIKNNFKSYLDNLTDISKLYELIQERDKKTIIIAESKPGFEKCLKVVSKYQ